MDKELQIFIIWENGRAHENEILQDISSKFDILQTFVITWPESQFARNLTRFYGKRIPAGCKKEKECGTGGFLVITAYDRQPHYVDDTHSSTGRSNSNTLQSKAQYRKLCGGGYLVHAGDNLEETQENLLFLLGLTIPEIEQHHSLPWNGQHLELTQEMIGASGWQDVETLENFIAKIGHTKLHRYGSDWVISTDNFARTARLLNLKKRFSLFKKNAFYLNVDGKSKNILLKAA